ncbi:MAG: hypothetical protein ACREDM_08355 [Methylocella sp.]
MAARSGTFEVADFALPPRPKTLALPGFSPRMPQSAPQAAQIKRRGKGR